MSAMNRMMRCICGKYTFKDTCPACGNITLSPTPPKYSPEDRYGKYRREAIEMEYGENGKYSDL